MKKLITLIICLITLSSFAQLDIVKTETAVHIGKITDLGKILIECQKYGEKYVFTYQDVKFPQIINYKSFSLRNEESFEDLYDFIKKNWTSSPKEDTMIKLKSGYLWVKFMTAFGTTNVGFAHAADENADVIGMSTWLSKRRLDKLFGKR